MIRTRTLFGRVALATLAAALTAAPAAAQTLPPARQILDRYVAAIGGKAAWDRVQSQRTVMEMSMSGMTIPMEVLSARPNRMLVKMTMPGMGEALSGYDGQVAWSVNPMQGPRVLEGAELAQTVRQADFEATSNPAKNYPVVETVERTEMGGQPCYLVRLVPAEGEAVHNCFHTETGLLVGSRTRQQSPMGLIDVETLMSEYRDFGGIKVATKTTSNMAGQQMTMTVKDVSANTVDPSVFTLPAAVRALVPAQPRP
jgi:outer membrane lipoprotein-sorting protein